MEKGAVNGGLDTAGVDSVDHMVQPVEDEETPTPSYKQNELISSDSSISEQPASRME